MKNMYFKAMGTIYGWAFKNAKLVTVISLIIAIINLAIMAIIWLVAGWKPALITYGVLSAIGISCWLIQLPYCRKVCKDIENGIVHIPFDYL